MNPHALVLAQSSLFNAGTPSAGSPKTGLIVFGIVAAIALVALVAKAAPRSSGSRSFNKGAFRRAARAAGLDEEDLRFLEEYARALGVTSPEFLFRNRPRLDSFFKDAYRQIEKSSESETEAEDRKARLFAARESLTHASAQGGAVRSTRQLGRGLPLTFITPGEESYPSVILAVEPGGLAVEPVADSYGESLRFRRGTKLSCYFYAKGHQGYQFASRVIGWEKMGGKEAMVLSHSDEVSSLPARRYARREMKAPCTFYRVAVTAGTGKGRGKSAAKVENVPYAGTILDISAGGLGIQSANALAAGEFVKIVFSAGGGDQSAFAKVLRMSKGRGISGIMHLQFVKISRQGLNAVLSYVYGYAD